MEDIRRDVFHLEGERRDRGAGSKRSEAGWRGLSERLQQMKTVPAFGQSYRAAASAVVICSEKRGSGSGVVLVGAEDDPSEPGRSTAALAMLISLAKAWDTRVPPDRTVLFCAWEGVEGFESLVQAPPVPWSSVSSAMLLGPAHRDAQAVAFEVVELEWSGSVAGLDFQEVQRRTVEVEGALRRLVTAAP